MSLINNTQSIDDYKIIKELGHGMVGTTYMVKLNQKKYALKIEKISHKHLTFNTKFPEWREIEFSEKFGNKYPEQFIQLYQYDIKENCDHVQEYHIDIDKLPYPQEVITKLKDKYESNYCIRKIYSLVDSDLSKIINDLNKKEIYSLIIQNAYIILLLTKNGYLHNDLHGKNIGVIKTKKKFINIMGIKTPTMGYNFLALDYGLVTKDTWELSEYEKKFKNKDVIRIITKLIKYTNNNSNKGFSDNKLLSIKEIDSNKFELNKKTEDWKTLSKYVSTDDDKIILMQIVYPKTFQEIVFPDNKINKLKYKIDLVDILYFMKYKSDLEKIIKYFICKINDKI